jgi:hypothetical protein
MSDVIDLLSIAALHLVLTVLPGAAAVALAARRGARDIPSLVGLGMVSTGLAAYLSFWCYFAAPLLGRIWAVAIPVVSLVVVIRGGTALTGDFLKRLATPVLLWALGVGFLLALGFIHGGLDRPLSLAATRFSHHLPDDNALPLYFSEPLYLDGHRGAAFHVRDWLSSDRPPLQIGFVVAQRPFAWDTSGLHYQVTGVTLQQIWIPAMWALLVAARVGVATRAMIMVVVLVSDLAIVNGFFVWPKMLAAAYLLAAAAFVLTDRWPTTRRDVRTGLLVAALVGLAMLAHGATVFGILAIAVVAAGRGLPTLKWVAAGCAVGLVLLVPWSLYQRYVDPPGNRLVKWLIAGVPLPDERGALQTLKESYTRLGMRGAIANKKENYLTILGRAGAIEREAGIARLMVSGRFIDAVRQARDERFFFLLQSLGVFAAAPVLMLMMRRRGRRHREEWTFAVGALQLVFVGCVIWGLLIFDAGFTIIATGTLAIPALALAGCVAGLSASAPRLAQCLAAVHVITILAIYGPVLDPLPGTSWSGATAISLVPLLLSFVLLGFRAPGGDMDKAVSSLTQSVA